ncbi:helix-turn-helix domain-containing protein [Polaromonas sp.]|uniref:helix-turn-helix domain-containing protein n=1 Tax=Polaromonas sp. TaxID=1869339 RepID=UPI002FCA52E8
MYFDFNLKFVKNSLSGAFLAMKMNVEAVLERFREAYLAPDLTTLAAHLGMDETTFRVWRTRKTVPPKMLVKASSETGRSISWLSDGFSTAEASTAGELPANFFDSTEKQVNLTPQELVLLENFRAATIEGRVAITAVSAALAKAVAKKRKSA